MAQYVQAVVATEFLVLIPISILVATHYVIALSVLGVHWKNLSSQKSSTSLEEKQERGSFCFFRFFGGQGQGLRRPRLTEPSWAYEYLLKHSMRETTICCWNGRLPMASRVLQGIRRDVDPQFLEWDWSSSARSYDFDSFVILFVAKFRCKFAAIVGGLMIDTCPDCVASNSIICSKALRLWFPESAPCHEWDQSLVLTLGSILYGLFWCKYDVWFKPASVDPCVGLCLPAVEKERYEYYQYVLV